MCDIVIIPVADFWLCPALVRVEACHSLQMINWPWLQIFLYSGHSSPLEKRFIMPGYHWWHSTYWEYNQKIREYSFYIRFTRKEHKWKQKESEMKAHSVNHRIGIRIFNTVLLSVNCSQSGNCGKNSSDLVLRYGIHNQWSKKEANHKWKCCSILNWMNLSTDLCGNRCVWSQTLPNRRHCKPFLNRVSVESSELWSVDANARDANKSHYVLPLASILGKIYGHSYQLESNSWFFLYF